MTNDSEIVIGKGIDKLTFGLRMIEVEDLLDKPDKVDEITDDGDKTIVMYYFNLGIDLSFEQEDEFRLSTITVVNPNFTLLGSIKIGDKQKDVEKKLNKKGLSDPELIDMSTDEYPNYELMAYDNESLDLGFEKKTLTEIQIGPLWDDDDNIVWPPKEDID